MCLLGIFGIVEIFFVRGCARLPAYPAIILVGHPLSIDIDESTNVCELEGFCSAAGSSWGRSVDSHVASRVGDGRLHC